MKNDLVIADLSTRKETFRAYVRSLSPDEKIARLVALQEQYYSMLKLRAANGGRPIPTDWQKWFRAKHR
ncbi:MAG: hypothetical protein KBD94_03645 [Pyrinomonadaceae bacterium]|nr:hypothetical protein [Pyrinomonadaceae bacterium]